MRYPLSVFSAMTYLSIHHGLELPEDDDPQSQIGRHQKDPRPTEEPSYQHGVPASLPGRGLHNACGSYGLV